MVSKAAKVRGARPQVTVEKVEEVVGPTRLWPGRCHEIAHAIVKAGLVPGGHAVYGLYHGPIAPDGYFGSRRTLGMARHGWVVMKGGIVDPTRWVFENLKPYIAAIPADDARAADYDEGGNVLRGALRQPPPPYSPDHKQVVLRFGKWRDHVHALLGDLDAGEAVVRAKHPRVAAALRARGVTPPHRDPDTYTIEQVLWLGNIPWGTLPPAGMRAVFRAIEAAGHGAYIPIDNRQRARARRA